MILASNNHRVKNNFVFWYGHTVYVLCRLCKHGTWASEGSVAAEECQETSRNEEVQGSWPKDCSQGSTSLYMRCVQGEYETRNAPLDIFATLSVHYELICIVFILFCSLRCQTPRPSSSTLRASIQKVHCPLNWREWKLKQFHRIPNLSFLNLCINTDLVLLWQQWMIEYDVISIV